MSLKGDYKMGAGQAAERRIETDIENRNFFSESRVALRVLNPVRAMYLRFVIFELRAALRREALG
jgi:hypothetical protein